MSWVDWLLSGEVICFFFLLGSSVGGKSLGGSEGESIFSVDLLEVSFSCFFQLDFGIGRAWNRCYLNFLVFKLTGEMPASIHPRKFLTLTRKSFSVA